MFALSKHARKVAAIRRAILALMHTHFSQDDDLRKADDIVWSNWLSFTQREWRDFRALLKKEDVRNSLKARALSYLTTPEVEWLPLGWGSGRAAGNWISCWLMQEKGSVAAAELPAQLQLFFADFVALTVKPALSVEKIAGNDEHYLNSLILQALTISDISSPNATELFAMYPLNDRTPFSGMDDSSGYNPYRRLMSATIPEHWKHNADQAMRTIIAAEQQGKTSPRKDWEDALSCYAHHTTVNLYSRGMPYSLQLFASQIDFIVAQDSAVLGRTIEPYLLPRIVRLLEADDTVHGTLYRAARFCMFGNRGERRSFTVREGEDAVAARTLLRLFGDADHELRNRLLAELEGYDAQASDKQKQDAVERQKLQDIMASMR